MSERVFVEVFEASAKDGSDLHKTVCPVIYGSLIVPGYYGWRRHVVRSGETLSLIAREEYGMANYEPLLKANPWLRGRDIWPGEVVRVPIGEG